MDSPAAPIVFFDIAGPDMAAQSAFYAAVLGWTIAADGAVSVKAQGPMQDTLQGTLRAEAANDSLLYFGVRDVTETLQKVTENGGTVDAPRFEVPGVVVMGLFRDPAGNRMGLVEVDENNVAIVP
jgi:hypothetical protein